MNNVTVLVVDDESRMRKLIKDFLVQKEFQVIEAEILNFIFTSSCSI